MNFTFTLTVAEVQEALANEVTWERWIELFEINSASYSDWDVDMKIASHFIEKLKEEYISKELPDDIPENLIPLLRECIKEDFIWKQKHIKEENCKTHVEKAAVKHLKDYDSMTFEEAMEVFEAGYEYCSRINEIKLGNIPTDDLLEEVKRRTTQAFTAV